MKLQIRGAVLALCVACVAFTPLGTALHVAADDGAVSHVVGEATSFLATRNTHQYRSDLPRQRHQAAAKPVQLASEDNDDKDDKADDKEDDNKGDEKEDAKADTDEEEKNEEETKEDTKDDQKQDAKKEDDEEDDKGAKEDTKDDKIEDETKEDDQEDEKDAKEDDKDDKNDDEEEGDSEKPKVAAPPGLASVQQVPSSAPARAPSIAPLGPQTPVVAVVTIENLDYDLLATDQSLHAEVEAAIRDALASEAGDDIDTDDVSLVSWSGSVRARALIKPTDGVSSESIVAELNASATLNSLITEKVSKLKGIDKAAQGIITVDVDVLVATMTSSVSKVMSRAKGQEHLSRVFTLEKEAAAARQRIGEVAAEEMKIDKKIMDLENQEAFTKMVDSRVEKVKGELQAPVFAETIGDMWKELRMFGTPCLLNYLRKEKVEIKVRIADAEKNATNVEEELQEARGDVKEAWYPTKSSSTTVDYGFVTALTAAVAVLLN